MNVTTTSETPCVNPYHSICDFNGQLSQMISRLLEVERLLCDKNAEIEKIEKENTRLKRKIQKLESAMRDDTE